MESVELIDENHKQSKYIIYKKYYDSCQKKSDKSALESDKVSLLRGIAGLLLFIGYQQKWNRLSGCGDSSTCGI